ncbi:hypothetical protein G7070_01395 [Propioniciclava coleopterorum]|uniref:Uncharacterized protein n=1 Tax=Propioniciclava coleopterorum TaxID=2714937 RepID=A0A6G7Y3C4_9ACTN|nr:hypothetical protein [Propioniciclava coleopterorum]QIK71186.1 hypothetical protein G7070_01395 [Propioniciclava coleopterorum]
MDVTTFTTFTLAQQERSRMEREVEMMRRRAERPSVVSEHAPVTRPVPVGLLARLRLHLRPAPTPSPAA